MDKIVGLCITIFIGIPLMVVSMVISWWMEHERDIEGQPDNDSDVHLYIPSRCRNRRRNNRQDMENKG